MGITLMTSTSRSKVMDEELEAIQRVDRRERLKRARERRERRAKMSKVNLNVTREPEDIYEENLCSYEKMFDQSRLGCECEDEDEERAPRASAATTNNVNVTLCLHEDFVF